MSDNIIVDIIRVIGPEKASQLFIGEPVEGSDAWILLDHLREKYRCTTLYENEEDECYVIVLQVAGKYMYILLKNNASSKGYFIEALTPRDYNYTVELAKKEYLKCINSLE